MILVNDRCISFENGESLAQLPSQYFEQFRDAIESFILVGESKRRRQHAQWILSSGKKNAE